MEEDDDDDDALYKKVSILFQRGREGGRGLVNSGDVQVPTGKGPLGPANVLHDF